MLTVLGCMLRIMSYTYNIYNIIYIYVHIDMYIIKGFEIRDWGLEFRD